MLLCLTLEVYVWVQSCTCNQIDIIIIQLGPQTLPSGLNRRNWLSPKKQLCYALYSYV